MAVWTPILSLVALGLLVTPSAVPAAAPALETFALANGVQVLVVPRPGDTKIQAGWVMAVGSADERPGETGQAQAVARLLDDGTRTLGTHDPDRERRLLVEADGLRARQRWADDKAAIDRRLAEIATELASIEDPEAFRGAYRQAGIEPPRSQVSEDSTLFVTEVPPDQLETWCRLETDRLKEPVFRRLQSVLDEARAAWDTERLLNLSAMAELRFRLTAWDGHPYAWPSSGSVADLTRLTRSMLENFQRGLYRPDRLTLVLVGPLEPAAVRTVAERNFGTLTGPAKALQVRAKPFLRPGQRSFDETVQSVPRLLVEYRTPGVNEPDADALMLIAEVLGGPEGRLQMAAGAAGLNVAVKVSVEPRNQLGSLRIDFVARRAGPDAKTFLAPLDREIDRLVREPLPVEELDRARTRLQARLDAQIADSSQLTVALLRDAGMGRPGRTLTLGERLARLTPADLQRAAAACLLADVRTVGVLQP